MAKIELKKKKDLLKILADISTPQEMEELEKLDTLAIRESVDTIKEKTLENKSIFANLEEKISQVLQTIEGYKNSITKNNQKQEDGMGKFIDALSSKLEELGKTISTSYEKNKPINSAGVYKDMINQLSSIDKSINNKPVPVWNWPQYASVGVRNKDFSNINPATIEMQQLMLNDLDTIITLLGGVPAPNIVASGQKLVTTAGIRVVLGSLVIKSITVKSNSVNTGSIYVGDSTVSSANGFILSPGETISFDINNLSDVYIDSSVNLEGVSFIYIT